MSYADSQLHLIGANFFYMQAKAFGIYQNATGAVLSNGFLNKYHAGSIQQVTEYFYHRFWGMYSYTGVAHRQFAIILIPLLFLDSTRTHSNLASKL